jgi:hypothetical protein
LASYLEKIKDIKDGLSIPEETYDNFLASYQSNFDFNFHASKIT